MRKISVCIPTYNRPSMTFECFEKVKDNENIYEFIIVEDAGSDDTWESLQKKARDNPKIQLFRNSVNLDCYRNKKRSIELADRDWCCLWDSDNVFGFDYLVRLFQNMNWDDSVIYAPSFAAPHFDFRRFEGLLISRENVSQWIDEPMFETMLNAANYFVNRDQYLKVWDGSIDPVTSDSIYMAYKWLEAGNKIEVVPGLEYHHKIHDGSHYRNNNYRTEKGLHDKILNNLREMK